MGIYIPDNPRELVKINYKRKLKKSEKVLQPWKGGNLTLQGKVTMINTLVIPQFIYLLMALPSSETSFFKTFEQKIFKFHWNIKPDKIKRQYIYNSYENGGLNLKNIVAMNLSLKASWITKIFHNSSRKTSQNLLLVYSFFDCKLSVFPIKIYHLDLLFKGILVNLSPFFENVLKTWLSFQYHPPDTPEDIQNQVIWMNSEVLIDEKPVSWETFWKNKIVFVNDILDSRGEFLSYDKFCRLYGQICNNFNFNQLISAIPINWKRKLKCSGYKLQVCTPITRCQKWLSRKKINKQIYNFHCFSTLSLYILGR